MRTPWVLLASCLEPQEAALLKELAAASGSKVVKDWSPAVTHVVCHVDKQGAAK